MAEHEIGSQVVLYGTIVAIEGDIALVRVDRSFPDGGTITVKLGKLPDAGTSEEDRARDAVARESAWVNDRLVVTLRRLPDAVAEAQDHPGRVITR